MNNNYYKFLEDLNIADPADKVKLTKRIQGLARAIDLLDQAIEDAKQKDKTELVNKLTIKRDEAKQLLEKIFIDDLDELDDLLSQIEDEDEPEEDEPEEEGDEPEDEPEEDGTPGNKRNKQKPSGDEPGDEPGNEPGEEEYEDAKNYQLDNDKLTNNKLTNDNLDSSDEYNNSDEDDLNDDSGETHADAESNQDNADVLIELIDDILDDYDGQLLDKQKEQLENLKNKLDDLKEQAEQAGDNDQKQDEISDKLNNISEKLNNLEDKLNNGDSDDLDDSNFEDENEDEDDDPIEDIFEDEENMSEDDIDDIESSKQPRKPTVDEIIQQLKALDDESQQGAIIGLSDLLNNTKNESLTEAIKTLRQMTDDEYGDFMNGIMDLLDDVSEVEDIEDRKARIQQLAKDEKANNRLSREDEIHINKSYQGTKARDKESDRYRNYKPIKYFELDLYDTIKNEVAMAKQNLQTYDEINNEYESEDIIMKADVIKEIPEEDKPIIDFYFDMSGSWTNDQVAMDIGKQAVATVKEFEDRDEIKLNIYYFSNADYDGFATSPNDGKLGHGTHSWKAIMQNILYTGATNVVVMTDSDMRGYADSLGKNCTVDGCVWFIWNGYAAEDLPKHLKGLNGTTQYGFNMNN